MFWFYLKSEHCNDDTVFAVFGSSLRTHDLYLYKTKTRAEAINRYEDWIRNGDGKYLLEHLSELENKTLGCFCKPKSCHGDILIKLIQEQQNPTLDFLNKEN